MSSKLCPFCMRMTEEETCPHCGENIHYKGQPAHLPAGYVVSGKDPYVLGAALGQGGFGITYIALNMVTGQRVAIKEYYPTYCSVRTDHSAVTAYQNQEEVYQKGKERFLDEARTLKSLSDLTCIVNVLDFFEANNTAYLVMEFLEGSSLKDFAAKNGAFPAQKFLSQIKPLMADIHRMHERGVIHRDIAPDNIILLPDGQMKLIDFGAARSYVGDKSMTVVVKKGFAPVEQYLSKGASAATDVYALAATVYYCITGKVPPDSAERQYDSTPLERPSALGADITSQQENALLRALETLQKERTQSVQAFLDDLSVQKPKKTDTGRDRKKGPRKPARIAAAIVLTVLTLGVCLDAWLASSAKDTAPSAAESQTDPWVENVLMADPLSAHSEIPRSNIQSVTFLDTCAGAPADARDVSQSKNGSVLAWVQPNGSCYDVYFAGEGGINGQNACEGLFSYCTALERVHFGGAFHTESAENMSTMFSHCTSLTSLDAQNLDTSGAASLYGMFSWCENLSDLDVSGWDTSHVTNMGPMFTNCHSLYTLDVSGWNTSNVTNMSSMFANCHSLSVLNVSGWDTSRVTDMSKMFYACDNLTSLKIGNWDLSNVESYLNFMSPGKQINGRLWWKYFNA